MTHWNAWRARLDSPCTGGRATTASPADRAVAGLAGAVAAPPGSTSFPPPMLISPGCVYWNDATTAGRSRLRGLAGWGCRTVPAPRTFGPFFDPAHLPRRGRPGQRRVRRAGANLGATAPARAPRPDRDARPVPAARGSPGHCSARRSPCSPPGGDTSLVGEGRRHEPRVCLIANRNSAHGEIRRQRGVDQAAAGPVRHAAGQNERPIVRPVPLGPPPISLSMPRANG